MGLAFATPVAPSLVGVVALWFLVCRLRIGVLVIELAVGGVLEGLLEG